jgi:hypothetical protein
LGELLLGYPDVLRGIGDRRRPSELLGEPDLGVVELEYQILEGTGNPYAPAVVPEMAFQLADDGR